MNINQLSEPDEPFPLRLVPIVALGFGTTQLSWSLFNLTVPVILSDDFAVSLAWVGFIMTWDNILAFFIQPTVGTYSDSVRTRWGRRMPFIIPGVIIASILFFLLSLSRLTFLTLFLFNIVVFNFVMALYRAPSASLMPDLVETERRSLANGILNFTGGVSAGVALLIAAYFLRQGNTILAFGVISFAMLLFLAILVSFISESDQYKSPIKTLKSDTEPAKTTTVTIKDIIRDINSELVYSLRSPNKSLIYIILAITSWFMAVNSIEAFYSTHVWKVYLPEEESDVAAGVAGQIIFIFPIIFVTFAVVGGFLGNKIGRILTCKIGSIIMVIGIFVASTIEENGVLGLPIGWENAFRFAFIFAGSGWGLVTVNSIVIVWEHTKDNGVGTGLYYAFTSLAAVLGPSFAGLFMAFTSIQNLFYFSAGFFLIGLFFVYLVTTGEVGDKDKIMKERGLLS